jgi:uncharacterized membrane protein (UPF0127 family)
MNKWILYMAIIVGVAGVSVLIPSYVAQGPTVTYTHNENKTVTSTTTAVVENDEVHTPPYVRINDAVFQVAVADTMALRSRGLSGHPGLGPMEGMLFVFSKPGIQTFWMKDMNFSIDMIWIAKSGEIVHIEPDVPPDTYPETFSSSKDALYVLEVSAGAMHDLGIDVGDVAEIVLGN